MTAVQIIERLRAIRERRLPVGYDLEGATRVSCQAFAESPTRAFCIVTDNLNDDATAVWGELVQVLEDPLVPKWTWNAHHELSVLKWAHGITLRGWEDGMALWFEKWPELPKGLKYAASILTRRPCWTAGINFDDEDETGATVVRGEPFYRYNMHDAAATIELALNPRLAPTPVAAERYRLRKVLIEALTWASLKGVNFDRKLAAKLRAELEPKMWAAQAEVDKLAGVQLPGDDSALLTAAARQWCHAVKLRRFILPGAESCRDPRAPEGVSGVVTPVDSAPGTVKRETDSISVDSGRVPLATAGTVAARGAGPASDLPQTSLETPASALLPDAAAVGTVEGVSSVLPTLPTPAAGHVTQGDPADGLADMVPLETATAGLVKKTKRVKKTKPPPQPLTWEAAISIAKKDGAAALFEIRQAHAEAATGKLGELLGLGVNVKSTPQVLELLDRLRLPKIYQRGEKGIEDARTKDADALLDLYLRTNHPVTVALLTCIALRTQLQELDRALDVDGRIRTSFISCGTTTDRTTSKKFLTGSGGNLQTVPKEPVNFRRCYVPDSGPAPGDEPL